MSLCDTLDGAFMRVAYGWGLASPERKIRYNVVITSLSVATALMIGTVQIVGLLSARLNLQGMFWRRVTTLDLTAAGFVIVGAFLAIWVFAIAIRQVRRP
jgi:high-affinity nickel-transport protein